MHKVNMAKIREQKLQSLSAKSTEKVKQSEVR